MSHFGGATPIILCGRPSCSFRFFCPTPYGPKRRRSCPCVSISRM